VSGVRRDILQSLSERDQRDKFLESLGWTVLPVEWAELDHPNRILAEVRRHLARLTVAASVARAPVPVTADRELRARGAFVLVGGLARGDRPARGR